jgi:hypothetical protein
MTLRTRIPVHFCSFTENIALWNSQNLPNRLWYVYCRRITVSRRTGTMDRDFSLIFRTREYKGCAIRAASYQVGPDSWAPEACFSQYTENGWRQLWVQSFGHLFGSQDLTFPSQKDADNYAFRLAGSLIDKIEPDLQRLVSRRILPFGRRHTKRLNAERHFSGLRRIFRDLKHRA